MKKSYSHSDRLALFIIVLIMVFTYVAMKPSVFNQPIESSFSTYLMTSFTLLGLFATLQENKRRTSFCHLWIGWCLWLIVAFYVFGLRGGGAAAIINVTFCPLLFLLFYSISRKSENVVKIASNTFVVAYAIAIYLVIEALIYMGFVIKSDEETPALNLVYWVVCIMPLLLLSEKRWIQFTVIAIAIVMVIITGKRGAAISVAAILFLFLIDSNNSRISHKKFFLTLVATVFLFLVIDRIIEMPFMHLMDRFVSLSDDQGSGRIPIYEDIFKALRNSEPLDWLLGHGYGSITKTSHSAAHNDALQMLFEYGLIGLFVYIMMLISIFKRAIILRKSGSQYFLGYASSVVIAVVLGMVSDLVVFYSYFSFVCVFWGIIEGRMVANKVI